jgi:hypothetical protein
MNALTIIGCAVGGGMLGFLAGFTVGMREGGDFNIALWSTRPLVLRSVASSAWSLAPLFLPNSRFEFWDDL